MQKITEKDIENIVYGDIYVDEITNEDDVYRFAAVVHEVAKVYGLDNTGPESNLLTHAFAKSVVVLMTLALAEVKRREEHTEAVAATM